MASDVQRGDESVLEGLIFEFLERRESEGDVVLDELCAAHPDLADDLRAHVERVRGSGLLEESTGGRVPERLGDFRLLEPLGSGGMGIVYRARQESLDREVALKLVRPEQLYFGDARARFLRELAALALIMRLLVDGLGGLHSTWAAMVMVVAVLSLLVGNIVAIAQSNIKRMLGYSAIAHVGFILLAVFTGTGEGYAAALFYTLTYVVAAAGAFGIVILLSRRGYDAENLSDFKGLNARSPWFALMMMFLMFSMAGVPPFVGFFAKLNVISVVIDAGYAELAVLMVLASVVGAYYYLRVIWYMYFEEAEDQAVLQASGGTKAVLSLNALAVLALGIVPGWLLAECLRILA